MPRGRPRKSNDVLIKSAEFIGWALGGLEREIAHTRERLSSLTSQAARLRARAGGGKQSPASGAAAADTPDSSRGSATGKSAAKTGRARRRNRMSPEARKRMSEMMKKRWAERRRKNA